jgi:hypothetical protein
VRLRKLISIILLSLLIFLLSSLLYRQCYHNYVVRTLKKYALIKVGMIEEDVVKILGPPQAKGSILVNELGRKDGLWDIKEAEISELKRHYATLIKFEYKAKEILLATREMRPKTGIDIYFDEKTKIVVLIHRVH